MNWTTLTKEQKLRWLDDKIAQFRQAEKALVETRETFEQWRKHMSPVEKKK